MNTPWGDIEALREQRLQPGRKLPGREAAARHQRSRIFAWMVTTAGRDGYAAARLHELERASGVAPSELYRLFDTKEECFLAAVEVLHHDALARIRAAACTQRSFQGALRAALSELAETIRAQPDAARMALVHVHEVGEQGTKLAERTTADFERLLAECLAHSPQRSSLPEQLPGAIAGTVQMLFAERLRSGRQDELPELAQRIATWTLSYRSPPAPLPRSQATVRPARRAREPDPGVRLLHAMAALCARKGYRRVSVNALAPEAKTSLRTLYQRYGGKERCFLECFEMVRARTLAAALAAFEPLLAAGDWPRAFHAAITAIMRYFASEPDFTRLVAVEVLAAGPVAFQARDEAIRSFIQLVEPGYRGAPRRLQIAREAIPFGIYAMIHRHLAAGHPAATLPRLVPVATFVALAPAIGAPLAAQISGEAAIPPAGARTR